MMRPYDFFETTLYDPESWNVIPEQRGLWFETEQDRAMRAARRELFEELGYWLLRLMVDELSDKQWQVVDLYLKGKKQDEIATILGLNQSTVSRTIYGIKRNGKTVGGVVRKMRKVVNGPDCPPEIIMALANYQQRRREVLGQF